MNIYSTNGFNIEINTEKKTILPIGDYFRNGAMSIKHLQVV